MRVAALYDIHGNLPALEAVLAEVEREGVDAIVVGGDIAAGPAAAARGRRAAAFAAERALHPRQRRPPLRRRVRGRRRACLAARAARRRAGAMARRAAVLGRARRHALRATRRRTTTRTIVTELTTDEKLAGLLRERRAAPRGRRATRTCSSSGAWGTSCSSTPAASGGRTKARRGAYWAILDDGVELRHTDYDLERAAELDAPLRPPAGRGDRGREHPGRRPASRGARCLRRMTELVKVGRVGKPHGLDGSFFVEHASEDEDALRQGRDAARRRRAGARSSPRSAHAAAR